MHVLLRVSGLWLGDKMISSRVKWCMGVGMLAALAIGGWALVRAISQSSSRMGKRHLNWPSRAHRACRGSVRTAGYRQPRMRRLMAGVTKPKRFHQPAVGYS